ncbi:hypothetical protein ACEZCY_15935 [Streptacidiphilus sp. N1-12]|uniref:Uncharacterized protein n=2 Tax=Streptacidiphilus alkalitolerans TaxID=3342712 RepID=A0ABV6VB97_9ACTN
MTIRFDRPQLPGTGKNLPSDIDTWLGSDAMRALLTAFGGDPEQLSGSIDDLPARCARLLEFTEQTNTRVGDLERHETGELAMTAEQAEVVLAVVDALGLRNSQPPDHAEYDHVLMLGGLIRACFNRPAYAAQLVREGRVGAGAVTALGAHRPFRENLVNPQEDERLLARGLGHPGLTDEYQALDLGTRLAFGLGEPESVEGETSPDPVNLPGLTWGIHHYRRADGSSARVAAAPSTEPQRRAHTGETYEFFAREMAELTPGTRLLLVTTPIYLPMQHFTAVRMLALPYGVEVETVGGDPAAQPNELVQSFTPTRYLNEIHTSARALKALADALAEQDER